jgi:tetratricopeptide (TPR) repeat protein
MNKAHPDDLVIQLDLAECYSAMAEAAILSGDMEAAQSRSDQALKLLNVYLVNRPRDSDALVKKAAQLGFLAGIQRDSGKIDDSNKSFEDALRLLDVVHEREPDHAMASYRLAWIWWQKARLTSVGDNANGDIVLMRQAAKLLEAIGKQDARLAPSAEQLLRTRAYLAGDLGHALQQGKDNKGSLAVFTEAVGYWKRLHDMRPHSVEYSDGLEWCEQRMNDLK